MSASTPEARALALFRAGRLAEARAAWSAILQATPDDPQALHMLGYILTRMGERDEGLRLMDRSVLLAPHAAPFLNNRAQVLAESGRLDEAARDLRRAVQLDPKFVAGYSHLAILLRRQGRPEEALAALRRALALEPNHAAARENLGLVLNEIGLGLKDRGDLPGAADAFGRAIAEGVASPAHFLNAASIAVDRGRLEEANTLYVRALAAKPHWADAEYGLGQVALRRLDFATGWRAYERRFDTEPPQSIRRDIGLPRWQPHESSARVAVWSEQGVGDQILFSTLLPEIARRAAHVVAEVDERLVAMYRRSLPAVEFTTAAEAPGAFARCDRQVALGSLGSLFRNELADFARQPRALLQPEAQRVARYRERLGAGRWIAVSWRSLQRGERQALGERKSLPLEHFAALEASGVRLLDVQYGDVDAERAEFMRRHPGLLTRFDDLDAYADLEGVAAAMAACERVATSSNVTAHVAGAIGQRTQLVYLGAQPPFSYWAAGRDGRCLWYPSVEIVADPAWHRWQDAVEGIRRGLSA